MSKYSRFKKFQLITESFRRFINEGLPSGHLERSFFEGPPTPEILQKLADDSAALIADDMAWPEDLDDALSVFIKEIEEEYGINFETHAAAQKAWEGAEATFQPGYE